MKIYIDFLKQAIVKIDNDVAYVGDVYSNVFEVLFFNYGDNVDWFPTMSQLAPNSREAGDFNSDALDVDETYEHVENGITYMRYTFTIGEGWVRMKGRSNFFIWVNKLIENDTALQRKCYGKISVVLNESTDNYFIQDVYLNPKIKEYIDTTIGDDLESYKSTIDEEVESQNATIASLSQASPSVFDTAANIQLLQENKGVAVATDTGYIWYWDTTASPEGYVSSGLQYNGLYYKNLTDVDVTVRNDTFNDGYVQTNDYTIIEATLSASLLTAITTSNYSFGCDMALLASDLGITLPTTGKTFYTKVSDSTGSFLFTDISSTSFNARVIKYSATDYEQTINLTFIHPTQNIGLVSFDPDHYFVLFEKTTAPAIVEINNDDIVQGGSFVEVWLKLTGVKLQGLLNITPKIYLTSDEEKTNLLHIPDTADTYNSNNTLVECQNGTLSVFSLASMLGKATLSDIYVLVDRVDISNWSSANYTFETTITTPTSSSSFKLEGYGEIIYKYGDYLESTYKAIVNVPVEINTINAIATATRGLSNDSIIQMIKGEAVQQISKRNIILKLGKDFVRTTQLIDYGDTEILFYPQIKITNITLSSELGEAYLFKTRIAGSFDYGRDAYLYLFKIQAYGGEFYRFHLSYTPIIVSIYYNDGEGKLVSNTGDMEQTIFTCSTEPMQSNNTPITSGAVYTALEAKQDVLTFDNAPTQNSNNPVKSGGVYDAIKQAIDDFKWELGTHTIDSETDSDVKYQKIAPVGTFGCEIDKLGGMSYKSENLIVLSDETTSAYTIKDGVITRLTNSVDRRTANLVIPITLIANQTYYFKDFNNTENDLTKRNLQFCSGSSVIINFGWRKVSEIYTPTENVVIDNIKFDFSETLETSTTIISPAIYKSNITEFEVGFSGIRNSAVTSVVANSTFDVPNAIRNLTGYGWGINENCYNYIDYERKVFVQKVGRAILGNLTWLANGAANSTYRMASTGISTLVNKISSSTTANALCEKYNTKTANETYSQQDGVSIGNDGAIFIYDSNYNTSTSVSSFSTAMSGVYLYYELATPVETDISQYLTDDDKYIDVESLGTITFTNTYEQDVPSEITYVTEVAK